MSKLELVSDDELASIPAVDTVLDGKFRVDGILGKGGMAVVLAATHLQLEQRVAIKVLLPACADDAETVARFLVEGRAAAKIRSEHVARVIDVGVDNARPYLVMEYLDGMDLDALLARDGPLPSTLAVDYVLQACEAIAEAHVIGIVHRDLKPANLFLTHRADGAACVKVLDFGISKILRPHNAKLSAHETSPLLLMGSPHYMSPEQMKSARNVDQRSDLWSIGAILHELVGGTAPFQGKTITALCAAIMTEEPPSLSSSRGEVAPELGAVVRRCLEKDPANRFANVADLAAALAPLGSDAARDSALCIARVLSAGVETDGGARPFLPAKSAADERTPQVPPSHAPSAPTHVGRLAWVVALLIACSGIGWAVVKRTRVLPAAASSPPVGTVVAVPAAPPVPSASASTASVHALAHPRVPVVAAKASAAPLAAGPSTSEPSAALVPVPPPTPAASDDGSTDDPY